MSTNRFETAQPGIIPIPGRLHPISRWSVREYRGRQVPKPPALRSPAPPRRHKAHGNRLEVIRAPKRGPWPRGAELFSPRRL